MNKNKKYVNTEGYKSGYKKGSYSKPTELDPEKKDNSYYLAWAQYVWSQYVSDRTLVPFGGFNESGRSFEELRAYALGKQDKSIYMDLLDDCDTNKTEGYLNINWDNVQIMSKFRDLVRGKMISMDFDVTTTAIDESSMKERMDQVNMMKLLTNPAIKEVIAATGVVPSVVKLPPGLETIEDIEMYNKLGGLRLSQELMIQDAIESTNYESRWDTLRGQLAEDVIDFNIAATITYLEKATGIVKVDHIDPKELICRGSKYQDHRDIDFGGFVRSKTIQQIRIESDLTEAALFEMAKIYRGQNGNANQINLQYDDNDYQNTSKGNLGIGGNSGYVDRDYNNFDVDIMEFYFVAKEAEKYIIGCHKQGNMIYDQVDLQAELDKRDEKRGKSIDEKEIEYVYKCKWIVGTKYVYECNQEYAVVRQGHNGIRRAVLPITIYSDRSPSLVDRCIPFIDDLQLAVLKKRNVLAKMAPGPRMAIDVSLLEDTVTIGNKNYSMLELIELFPKTGTLVYSSRGEFEDSEMSGSNRPPITFMPSGVQEDIQILLSDAGFNIDQIRQVTGINEVADGTSQQQDMLVKVMEGLSSATNNSLRPHFQVYFGLYENQCKYVAQKWQVAVLTGEIKTGYIPIGENILKPVVLSKDLYDYDFGIKIGLKPTAEDKQMLLQQLIQEKANGQISGADYFVVYNMIQAGDYKKAQLFLAKASERWTKRIQQMEIEKMNAQAQGNAQAAQVAEQAKMQTLQLEMQLEMQKLQAEAQLRMQENEQKHMHKMKEIALEKQAETEGAIAKDLIKTEMQNQTI